MKLTKAQRSWLETLVANGPTKRARTNVGYTCMMRGWTEWFVKLEDGRIERLEGQDTARAVDWLDSITPAGRAALQSEEAGK
jgi:hypothetical protein